MNTGKSNILGGIPAVTLNIIIITVICWVAQLLFETKGIEITNFLGLHYFKSENFYYHQLITYMFMHDTSNIMHLFFNMFAVFMFGRTLEVVWGPKRFLFYYIVTGIGAALVNMLVTYLRVRSLEKGISPELLTEVYKNGLSLLNIGRNYVDPDLGQLNLLLNSCTIGASGAVFGILLAFGMLFPNVELMIIPIPIPIKAKYFVILYGLAELLMGLWGGKGDNIAHFAHVGGLLTGLIIILYWKKVNKKNGRFY